MRIRGCITLLIAVCVLVFPAGLPVQSLVESGG
jgi:hypothetical protein